MKHHGWKFKNTNWAGDPIEVIARRRSRGQSSLYLLATVAGFFLWVGIREFTKVERSFADIV